MKNKTDTKNRTNVKDYIISIKDLMKLDDWVKIKSSPNDKKLLASVLYKIGADVERGFDTLVGEHRPISENLVFDGVYFKCYKRLDYFKENNCLSGEDVIIYTKDETLRKELHSMKGVRVK